MGANTYNQEEQQEVIGYLKKITGDQEWQSIPDGQDRQFKQARIECKPHVDDREPWRDRHGGGEYKRLRAVVGKLADSGAINVSFLPRNGSSGQAVFDKITIGDYNLQKLREIAGSAALLGQLKSAPIQRS